MYTKMANYLIEKGNEKKTPQKKREQVASSHMYKVVNNTIFIVNKFLLLFTIIL